MSVELSRPQRVFAKGALLFGAAGVALTGCSSGSADKAPAHSTSHVHRVKGSDVPFPSIRAEVRKYEFNPVRNWNLNTVIQGFGEKILAAYDTASQGEAVDQIWSNVSASCIKPSTGSGQEYYTSLGYKPVPGDQCTITISHEAPKDGTATATFMIDADGQYANVTSASVNSSDCSVQADKLDDNNYVWNIQDGVDFVPNNSPKESGPNTTDYSLGIEYAQSLDNNFVSCIALG